MTVKDTAIRQYRAIVDRAVAAFDQISTSPGEGWIATARIALGMSAAQLGRRSGLTRARISQAEHAEQTGGITLKTLRAMAEAMDCRLVYAIIPNQGKVDDVIAAQAHRKAEALVKTASIHMALEQQALSSAQNRAEVERVARELVQTMPADFWDAP